MIKKLLFFWFTTCLLLSSCGDSSSRSDSVQPNFFNKEKTEFLDSHPLANSARQQIGVVTQYDTGYYQGGYPPEDRGACTDVLERALRENDYDLKAKIDQDMAAYPELYPTESDPNINFRRVRNVQVFLEHHAQILPTCIDPDCFDSADWRAGDIVTFDQIPGSLWHVAIISNQVKTNSQGLKIPFLIHNYGQGTVENDKLLTWPAPVTGHYRLVDL